MKDPTSILINSLNTLSNDLSKFDRLSVAAPDIAAEQADFMEKFNAAKKEIAESKIQMEKRRVEFEKEEALMNQRMAKFDQQFDRAFNYMSKIFGF